MSEALRLAELIERDYHDETLAPRRAAAELRRLHDLVTEDSILQRRQRDEIAQLGQALARAIERNNELEAELAEQARVNGMGSEREARLMALNAELVEALREMWELWNDNPAYGHEAADKARELLAKAQGEMK